MEVLGRDGGASEGRGDQDNPARDRETVAERIQRTPGQGEKLALAVLNPGGRDPYQSFATGYGTAATGDGGHPPVNYHAYAAATGGGFHREVTTIPAQTPVVLLLLRRDLKLALKTMTALRRSGKRVWISLKEAGTHQVAALLGDARRLALFREAVETADGALASTPDLVSFYLGAGARQAVFVPTPYPVGVPEWDLSRPLAGRRGLFIGTREWGVPSRNHLAALLAARQLVDQTGLQQVTVLNADGRHGRKCLAALDFPHGSLHFIEGRLDYRAYLRLMAQHRLVFQLDRSAVPGQVAGDALLCRIPCVGGDGAIERIAFPESCGFGRETGELVEIAARLLTDEAENRRVVDASQQRALEILSFPKVAARLAEVMG
ncbi:MAG TPA: hypothetical protein VNQ90_09935 [Chthoniobacteraceae bacterium]|nr:hypothetical protein [Chthoniobacteraceae bacterium]